jgi:hypothetical protein
LNLNKKVRGERRPNPEPVRKILDAEKLLANVKLTQSLIVGKISEYLVVLSPSCKIQNDEQSQGIGCQQSCYVQN